MIHHSHCTPEMLGESDRSAELVLEVDLVLLGLLLFLPGVVDSHDLGILLPQRAEHAAVQGEARIGLSVARGPLPEVATNNAGWGCGRARRRAEGLTDESAVVAVNGRGEHATVRCAALHVPA